MFVPHNFADSDPSRQSVQGVRLQLQGKKSGGFAGEWFTGDESKTLLRHNNGDLRSRSEGGNGQGKTTARYFGATYKKGVEMPLEALEPDMRGYVSHSNAVSELDFTGFGRGETFGG